MAKTQVGLYLSFNQRVDSKQLQAGLEFSVQSPHKDFDKVQNPTRI